MEKKKEKGKKCQAKLARTYTHTVLRHKGFFLPLRMCWFDIFSRRKMRNVLEANMDRWMDGYGYSCYEFRLMFQYMCTSVRNEDHRQGAW